MQGYANNGGDSGVSGYEYGDDYIIIEFKEGKNRFYKYTYLSAGRSAVDQMKNLADVGHGLNSYVSTYKPKHSEKW